MALQKNKIAIFTNKPYDKCETFIKAQLDLLPFQIVHYWGSQLPFNLFLPQKSFFKKVLYQLGIKKKKSSLDVVAKEFINNQIEIVFAHYGMVGAKIFPVCKLLNLPLVVHFHGHDAVRKNVLKEFESVYLEMFLYPKSIIISVSHEMTKRLIQLGCPKEKIYYNPYGPNVQFINVLPVFSKRQFVSIGRFVDKKAPHLTIMAFKKVVDKYPDAKFVFAGDGLLLDSCIDLSIALRLQNNIVFAGRITADQFCTYLSESLAYVQHSIEAQDGDMEGTPVSILEASGAGLPVISTIHAGIPDVILNGETGLLCHEHDIDTMADNMLSVVENLTLAKTLGQKGKIRISEFYSMEKHIANTTNIINTAILLNDK